MKLLTTPLSIKITSFNNKYYVFKIGFNKIKIFFPLVFILFSCTQKKDKMNPINQSKTEILKSFIESEKYKDFEYLNPSVINSSFECKIEVENIFNKYCTKILPLLENENANKQKILDLLKNIDQETINSQVITDTEDHEFCYFLLRHLCSFLDLNIDDII